MYLNMCRVSLKKGENKGWSSFRKKYPACNRFTNKLIQVITMAKLRYAITRLKTNAKKISKQTFLLPFISFNFLPNSPNGFLYIAALLGDHLFSRVNSEFELLPYYLNLLKVDSTHHALLLFRLLRIMNMTIPMIKASPTYIP